MDSPLLLWLCAGLAVLGHAHLVRAEEESVHTKLRYFLQGQSDPLVRPDVNATQVNVTLGVKHIAVVEITSTLMVSAWIKLEWLDQRNAWSHKEEFTAVPMVHLASGKLWCPDVVLKNGLAGKAASLTDNAPATVYADGRVSWTPTALLEVYCELDLRRWPFDTHACTLRLGSWNLDRTELRYANTHAHLEFPGQLGEFIVDAVDSETDSMTEDGKVFEHTDFLFRLHRAPGTYRAIIFTPAAVVMILCLATFWLPPRAGEKIVLGGVNAMLICLFLIFFAHALPVPTDQTPFVVMFYTSSLYLVSLSLVASVLVLNISRQSHAAALPWAVKSVLTGTLGRALLLGSYIEQLIGVDNGPCSGRGRAASRRQEELPVVLHEESTDTLTFGQVQQMHRDGRQPAEDVTGEIATRKVQVGTDWLLLAAAIDRVLFLVYSLLFVVLAVAFHV